MSRSVCCYVDALPEMLGRKSRGRQALHSARNSPLVSMPKVDTRTRLMPDSAPSPRDNLAPVREVAEAVENLIAGGAI
jgi:hypothetical protein